jgi:hypothetical protein
MLPGSLSLVLNYKSKPEISGSKRFYLSALRYQGSDKVLMNQGAEREKRAIKTSHFRAGGKIDSMVLTLELKTYIITHLSRKVARGRSMIE